MEQVLKCQRKDCKRGVYIRYREVLMAGKVWMRIPQWRCYAGHVQYERDLRYANINEIDDSIIEALPWHKDRLLADRGREAVHAFAVQIGLSAEELEASDWRPFDGDVQPHRRLDRNCTYRVYRVITTRGIYFFWLSASDPGTSWLPWYWQREEKETRNGYILIARDGTGAIVDRLIGTRGCGLQGALASARWFLLQLRHATRIEVHKQSFGFEMDATCEDRALAVVTLDDLSEYERAHRGEFFSQGELRAE
ncbi:hypothetical protein EI42_02014 [Thermosporothrix hazakensis]|jgi:hypothetical protein|uniref:Uncharacterized protein n=1 Tax=Thermosporothrix hazakensis TaxID=644383 RepID=A0A326UIK4_THEHA|nr:hypothetical protein [Thermosporothrix hazakensis]PZW31988.1 hypothetical protein EI42_02014 [Thermosporothrix hazakensis]GCE49686.1 hypothetical protein KTH_45550 [Thermosporothrix hazakensis]